MPDAIPMQYGTDLSKRGSPGRLLPEQRDAHARLASLPTWGRRTEPPDELARRRESWERARRTMQERGTTPTGGKLPASIVAAREVAKEKVAARAAARQPGSEPKQRKKRTSFVILAPRSNKWSFAKGDWFEVISGKYTGARGQYMGAANSRDVYLRIDGTDRAIWTERLRRIEG